VLGSTPRWASKRPNEAGNYGPGTAAEPKDIRTWRAYVRKLAIRYKGKVNKWELYNEPNVKLFFSGQPKDMVTMAREAWVQLKTIDAGNTVISPGVAIRTDNSPKWLDTYLALGGGKYANVIAVHLYVRARQKPEDTIGYLAIVRAIMKARGVSRMPLWNTESGYGRATSDPRTNEIYTGSTAMGYVARTYILMAAGNVARSYWYGWDMRGFTGLYLTNEDQQTANVAGKAYGVTYRWLVGARISGCTKAATGPLAGGYSCSLARGTAQVRILWHPTTNRRIRIPAGYRSLQRLDGSKVAVRAGSFLNIGPLPVYLSTAR
ncbi:MAG: glycosyl hydrolase, partial [Mycobacteriales bacterium]